MIERKRRCILTLEEMFQTIRCLRCGHEHTLEALDREGTFHFKKARVAPEKRSVVWLIGDIILRQRDILLLDG